MTKLPLVEVIGELIANARVEDISLNSLTVDKSMVSPGRTYGDGKTIESLALNLESHPLLQPLVVFRHEENGNTIHSVLHGVKRLKALRLVQKNRAKEKMVPCLVLAEATVQGQDILTKVPMDEIRSIVKIAAIELVIASEIHSTKISEETWIDLFSSWYFLSPQMKMKDVLKRLGMSSKDKAYNNFNRLWRISRNHIALEMVAQGLVTLSFMKSSTMHHLIGGDPLSNEKLKTFRSKMVEYIRILRNSASHKDRDTKPVKLKGYSIRSVRQMADDIYFNSLSEGGRDALEARNQYLKIDAGSKVHVPSFSVNFDNHERNEISWQLELLFQMSSFTTHLFQQLKAESPLAPGGQVLPFHGKFVPPDHGERYVQLVEDLRMENYCNIWKVKEYFDSIGDPLASEDDLKGKTSAAKIHLLIERLTIRHENKLQRHKQELMNSKSIEDQMNLQFIEAQERITSSLMSSEIEESSSMH